MSSTVQIFTKYGYNKVMAELKRMSGSSYGTSFYAILHNNHIVGYIALFEDDIWGEIAFVLSPGGLAHPAIVDDAISMHVVYISDSDDPPLVSQASMICFDEIKDSLSRLGIFYTIDDLDKENPMKTIRTAFSLAGYNLESIVIR